MESLQWNAHPFQWNLLGLREDFIQLPLDLAGFLDGEDNLAPFRDGDGY